jgi:hypothetical protein
MDHEHCTKRKYASGAQKRTYYRAKQLKESSKTNRSIKDFLTPASASVSTSQPNDSNFQHQDILNAAECDQGELVVGGEEDQYSDLQVTPLEFKTDSKVYKSDAFRKNTGELYPTDKALFDNCSSINEELLIDLVTHGACQPNDAHLDRNCSGRKFNASYYFLQNSLGEKRGRHWLAYSFRKGYVYCHMCWLFGSLQAKTSTFVSPGITDMKHLSERIKTHASSQIHAESMMAYHMFNKSGDIQSSLDKQISSEAAKWREVLTLQFSLIRTMAGLNLPFRGDSRNIDDPNCGVYLSLLKEISKTNPTLMNHLQSESRIRYLSETITNEQIEILAKLTLNKIIEDIQNAKYWTIITDSTTDISHRDQIAILVRYVSVDYEHHKVDICESFLTFVEVKDATAKGITSKILQKIEDLCLDIKYMRGQAYDGASVMSGCDGGVQAVLRRAVEDRAKSEKWSQSVFLPYVHCPPHQLALVLLHAAKTEAPIRIINFFGVVEDIYSFMVSSNRRWSLLLSKSETNSLANQSLKNLRASALKEE